MGSPSYWRYTRLAGPTVTPARLALTGPSCFRVSFSCLSALTRFVRAPTPKGDRHEICHLHCRNSDACRGSRRLCGPVLPALWLPADLLLSVRLQLSSELQLLSRRIWLLSDPLRLRIDWLRIDWRLLPQLQQRNTLRSAGYFYPC